MQVRFQEVFHTSAVPDPLFSALSAVSLYPLGLFGPLVQATAESVLEGALWQRSSSRVRGGGPPHKVNGSDPKRDNQYGHPNDSARSQYLPPPFGGGQVRSLVARPLGAGSFFLHVQVLDMGASPWSIRFLRAGFRLVWGSAKRTLSRFLLHFPGLGKSQTRKSCSSV